LFLGCEDGEVEVAQAIGIAEDFDLGDLSVCEGESECAEEAPFRSDDQADRSVDECRLCGDCATGGGDCALRPVLRAADLSHGLDRLGCSVGCDDDIRVEHGDERVEVSGAQGGEEGIDDLALTDEIGTSCVSAPWMRRRARLAS
jgi:hypothetical protein